MAKHGGRIFEYPGVMDYSANISPLGMPHGVAKALYQAIENADVYPDPDAGRLCASIASKYGLQADQVLCGNGAAELIYAFARVFAGKNILLPVPIFQEYEDAFQAAGCRLQKVVCSRSNDYLPDITFLDEITENIDLVMLCSPSNPIGKRVPNALLEQILDRCQHVHAMLAVDECFLDFIPGQTSMMMQTKAENLIVFRSFTKLYAIPGVRLGYCMSRNKVLLSEMKSQLPPWNVSGIAQAAGLAALAETDYVDQVQELVAKERSYLQNALAELGFDVICSEVNFIFFRGKSRLYEELLAKGILIRDCSSYSGLDEGAYRIAVRTHEENQKLIRALEELTEG